MFKVFGDFERLGSGASDVHYLDDGLSVDVGHRVLESLDDRSTQARTIAFCQFSILCLLNTSNFCVGRWFCVIGFRMFFDRRFLFNFFRGYSQEYLDFCYLEFEIFLDFDLGVYIVVNTMAYDMSV